MKIALIVPGGVDPSGEVRVIPALLALIRRLARKHDLHVFATHQEPMPADWMLEGAVIHNLGLPRTARRALKAMRREHDRGAFRIVHSIWAGSTGALAVAAGTLLRVPSIVHVAGGELVALSDIEYGGCRSLRGRMLQSAVLHLATQITAASEPICELVGRYGIEARRVPLGVDLDRWPRRLPRQRDHGEKARLLHVASLNHVKDQPTLLRALRLLVERGHEFHLDVVGEDTLGGKIQAMANQLGMDRHVRFHGFLSHSQLRPLVEAAHAAVFSSRHEAGPVAVLEAAAVGVPAVGTAVGHIAEWSPQAAIAVPCQNSVALADALECILQDEDLRMRLASAALSRAESEDADETAHCFREIYRHLTQRDS